jgi:hypothetical protein
MIDEIGYWPQAVQRTADLLGVEQIRVVRYLHRMSFSEMLMGVKSPLDLSSVLPGAHPRLLYLWKP